MERLDFSEGTKYNAIEASIHLNRYLSAKKFVAGKKVLDIACGEGYGSYLMKQWGAKEVTGVDISEEALAVAKEKFSCGGIIYINHTAEELPFENDCFDVVVSYETVEHLDYPEKFLAEIKRVAKKEATIIISCPNDPYYYKNDFVSNPYHKRKYTWFDFSELSRKYLGDDVEWYFGFATNGYMTIPEKECKLPDKDDLENIDMQEMLKENYMEFSIYVQSDRYINHWNANYYLGVWGNNECVNTVVSFPREIFIEPDDPIFADVEAWDRRYKKIEAELEDQRVWLNQEKSQYEEYKAKLEEEKERNIDLAEEIRVSRIQERRTSSLLEVANKEKAFLWNRINRLERVVNEKNVIINDLEKREEELKAYVNEYERYKRSISYKLMQPIRKLWNILRFWRK